MEEPQATPPYRSAPVRRNRRMGWVVGGLVAGAAVTAGVLAAALPATADSTGKAGYAATAPGQRTDANTPGRPGETLLTGTDADKARAAALAAVPGATVVRLETDADGAVYEAHLTKSDGTAVTVKFDKNFTVTGIEAGMGSGPAGGGGPGHGRGTPPNGTQPAPGGSPSASPTG